MGFRPGRSAHDAVLKARDYVAGGKRWMVDMDLEKFFDRVNHDVLMARVARRVKDRRVLRLVRRYPAHRVAHCHYIADATGLYLTDATGQSPRRMH